jgi:hypothetical protein
MMMMMNNTCPLINVNLSQFGVAPWISVAAREQVQLRGEANE